MFRFNPGDRVRLRGHREFADGAIGTIAGSTSVRGDNGATLVEWPGGSRLVSTRSGLKPYYLVEFDQPQDDGSGDGPYVAAEIDATSLLPYDDPEPS